MEIPFYHLFRKITLWKHRKQPLRPNAEMSFRRGKLEIAYSFADIQKGAPGKSVSDGEHIKKVPGKTVSNRKTDISSWKICMFGEKTYLFWKISICSVNV